MQQSSQKTVTKPGSQEHVTHETIVILDFGAQYSHLIARRVRECHVYCELMPPTTTYEDIRDWNLKGIILSGGPSSVYEQGAPHCDQAILESGLPILGICYGMQIFAHQLGGQVSPASGKKEFGPALIEFDTTSLTGKSSDLLKGIQGKEAGDLLALPVWMSHGDSVTSLPPGFKTIAHTDNTPIAAIAHPDGLIGLQFHPEVTHTPQGKQILENFLYHVCGCSPAWTSSSFIEESVEQIRRQVGTGRVICGLSGGVDSAVAAALIHQAIGDQLTCIFVDTGCLRADEPEQVVETFRQHLHIRLVAVDARKRFLQRLAGVTDPEEKRRAIGNEFIRVFEEEAEKIQHEQGPVEFLAQGTLYPDVIESAGADTQSADRIKTHHNVGGLPKDLKFKLVEPLRYLFKDEVREVGRVLGLPEDWVWRHPFPGPGLAIRVIGDITEERLNTLRKADKIVVDEIKAAGLYRELGQSFAVLTPLQSVGVMGDGRTYANVLAVRAVTTGDFMTADWARLPYDLLGRISNRIVNEVVGINRVVYDITSKPPATIEWE